MRKGLCLVVASPIRFSRLPCVGCGLIALVEFESGKRAVSIKNVSLAEEHLHDHFPGFPVMPHSLILEGLAQTGGILLGESHQFSKVVVLAKVPRMTFTATSRLVRRSLIGRLLKKPMPKVAWFPRLPKSVIDWWPKVRFCLRMSIPSRAAVCALIRKVLFLSCCANTGCGKDG